DRSDDRLVGNRVRHLPRTHPHQVTGFATQEENIMHENLMRRLAARAHEGDSAARREFQQEALPRMLPVIRRALCQNTPENALVSRIRAVADGMNWDHGPRRPEQDDEFVFRVAQALCASVTPPRRAGLAPRETVRC